MPKKKVLLLLQSISDYRVPIYNIINEKVDLTVAYNISDNTRNKCDFKKKKLDSKKIGNFYINNLDFFHFCNKFSVVIMGPDNHSPMYCVLPFLRTKYKVIPWLIGIRITSKNNIKKWIRDYVIYFILKKSDAILFYMEQAILYWNFFPLDKDKIFIAHNTVKVNFDDDCILTSKKNILFIGTLNKRKGLDSLLKVYLECYLQLKKLTPILDIVGSGEEEDSIRDFIIQNKLEKQILLHGAVFDENVIEKYFAKAIACISPKQSGLSVLKSMGYGVPFITHKNAITGGERFNIHDRIDGRLFEDEKELLSILKDISKNPTLFLGMGVKAREYYKTEAYPEKMANGVISAIEYVLKDN